MYVLLNSAGRLRAISPDSPFLAGAGETAYEMELPEEFDVECPLCNWLYVGDTWRYDPQPEPEVILTPTLGERVAAVEAGQATQDAAIDELVQVMADMIGGAV